MTNGLGGHFLPGTQFVFIGLWWIYSGWLRFFLCRQRKRNYFVSFAFPLIGFGSRVARIPVEQLYMLIGATIGFCVELSAGFQRRIDPETEKSSVVFAGDSLHHFAMYLLFFFLGIVELFVRFCDWLPKDLEMVAGTFAFAGQAFLFYFHGQNDVFVEGPIHSILFLTICATTISIVVETVQREKQIVATLMRGYFTILQGAWFYVAGFYLDPYFSPSFDRDDHDEMHRFSMLLALYFTFLVVSIFLVVIVVGFFAKTISERCAQTVDFLDPSRTRLIQVEDGTISD